MALVVGLGLAAELAHRDNKARLSRIKKVREEALAAFAPLRPTFHGASDRTMPHVLNLSFPGLDSEAVMLGWKGLAAVSNGSACTSHAYEPSHVLRAMGLDADCIRGALRISWCHLTDNVDWSMLATKIRKMQP